MTFGLTKLKNYLILNRLYTQNIDGLEYLSGIQSNKLVEAHGSFRSASCITCGTKYSGLFLKVRLKKNFKKRFFPRSEYVKKRKSNFKLRKIPFF